MDKPATLPEYLHDLWDEIAPQLLGDTPPAAGESLCRQMHLLRDAEERVSREGAVIVDGKGNAAEHPAIKIQRDASNEVRRWLQEYRR